MSASFKNNASFVSRLPTIRRHKSTSLHSPAPHSKPAHHRYDVNASAENLGKPSSNEISHTHISTISINLCKIQLNKLMNVLTYMHILVGCLEMFNNQSMRFFNHTFRVVQKILTSCILRNSVILTCV